MRKFTSYCLNLRTGDDREHKLLRRQLSSQLAEDRTEALWFDGENNDGAVLVSTRFLVAKGSRFGIAFNYADSVPGLQFIAAHGARVAAHYLTRRHQLAPQQAGDDCLGHHPATNKRQ